VRDEDGRPDVAAAVNHLADQGTAIEDADFEGAFVEV
jgi:hypothetical protein